MEVIHQSLPEVGDAHSTIDRFVKHQLGLLHLDRNEIFIEYCAMLEVWFCYKFQCFLEVVD